MTLERLSETLSEDSTEKITDNFKKLMDNREVPPFTIKYETEKGKTVEAEIDAIKLSGGKGEERVVGTLRKICSTRD